jgi:hypothetical protein
MEIKPIQLTKEEVRELSTLLSTLVGRIQHCAAETPDGSLDEDWKFWHGISKKVDDAHGYQAYCVPSDTVRFLLKQL